MIKIVFLGRIETAIISDIQHQQCYFGPVVFSLKIACCSEAQVTHGLAIDICIGGSLVGLSPEPVFR